MIRRLLVVISLVAIAAVGLPAHAGTFLPATYRFSASWQYAPSGNPFLSSWFFEGRLNRAVPDVGQPAVEPNRALGPDSGAGSIQGSVYIPSLPDDASVQQYLNLALGDGSVAWSDGTTSRFTWHVLIEGNRVLWSGNVVSGRWVGGTLRGAGVISPPPPDWNHAAKGTYLGEFTFLPPTPIPTPSLPAKAPPGCIAVGDQVGRCTFTYDRNSPDLLIEGAAESWSVTVNGSSCARGFLGAEAKIDQCAADAGATVLVTAIDGVLSVRESPITII